MDKIVFSFPFLMETFKSFSQNKGVKHSHDFPLKVRTYQYSSPTNQISLEKTINEKTINLYVFNVHTYVSLKNTLEAIFEKANLHSIKGVPVGE